MRPLYQTVIAQKISTQTAQWPQKAETCQKQGKTTKKHKSNNQQRGHKSPAGYTPRSTPFRLSAPVSLFTLLWPGKCQVKPLLFHRHHEWACWPSGERLDGSM